MGYMKEASYHVKRHPNLLYLVILMEIFIKFSLSKAAWSPDYVATH